MTQRTLAVAVLSCLIWTAPLLAQAPAGAATYRVTIVLYPGHDPAAVARRLAMLNYLWKQTGQILVAVDTPVDQP